MKEAILYNKVSDTAVRCLVCNHYCYIKSGNRGICGVRENRQGTLFTLNYGLTIASAIDPIEKKPLYHFLPGSYIYSIAAVGCNMHCMWCQNWDISQSPKPDKLVEGIDISPEEHCKRAIKYRCPSIAYTYSEPTIFLEYALEIMKLAHEKGLKNVWVSNGYMSKETIDLIIPYLDAINIDFKGPDDEVYKPFCGATAKPVISSIKRFCKANIHVEITTLIVPGVNDRCEQIEAIAHTIVSEFGCDIPWHISRFFPAWKMLKTPETTISIMETAKKIGETAGIKYIYLGNI
ncbi:MAG: AmmeMemoRadiSam system radical SAM enzyme [Candidatus Izemoplasmatales bacterium]|nr:AmmeMemoRadiSam system radical SAM enzyme [Candidatus Izemoplasmatales bacterium]MDD3865197.1 AmmeMemoRadiSam system radical SAM enzyme [Candidatus Izemoplasmatales bacterium]